MGENDELNRKIKGMYRKKVAIPRLIKISLASILGIVLISGIIVGMGYILPNSLFPDGPEEVVLDNIGLTISDVSYDETDTDDVYVLTIQIEANSTTFPEINATYIWFVPTNTRFIWSWIDNLKSPLDFVENTTGGGVSTKEYTSNSTLTFSPLEFAGIFYEMTIKMETVNQTYYLSTIKDSLY